MKFGLPLLALVALLVIPAIAGTGDLHQLTTENLDQTIASGKWFIKFYAPWCGFCKRLEPIWDEFAKESSASDVNVARVNCDEHKMLCRRFGVNGYPTLKLVVDGKLYDYPDGGERTVVAFKEFSESGYLKDTAQELPTGAGIADAALAVAEIVVVDLITVYESHLVAMVVITLGAALLAIIGALITMPMLVGFNPTFIVPQTIYVLRRPGQPPVRVSEPSKYKIKAD